jgi:hypothetical protein
VGRIPAGVSTTVALPSGRVIGSVRSRDYTSGALVVAGTPRTLREQLTAESLGAGWRVLEVEEPPGFQSGRYPRAQQFCHGDTLSLGVIATPSLGDSSNVRFFLHNLRDQSPCKYPRLTASPWESMPIPTLPEPPGVEVLSTGIGGGGPDDWSGHAQLRTERPLADLLDHYSTELEERGWASVDRVIARAVAVQTFALRDERSVTWDATLTVSGANGEVARRVSLSLWRRQRHPAEDR